MEFKQFEQNSISLNVFRIVRIEFEQFVEDWTVFTLPTSIDGNK